MLVLMGDSTTQHIPLMKEGSENSKTIMYLKGYSWYSSFIQDWRVVIIYMETLVTNLLLRLKEKASINDLVEQIDR
jgi:hypothetical protein